VPIIAVILLLLAPKASLASVGFATGWNLGIVAVTVTALLLSSGPTSGAMTPDRHRRVVGEAAPRVRQWRGRPGCGEDAPLPTWMTAIDHVTPVKALGLGVALSAVNPKNLLLAGAAGVTISDGALGTGQQVAAVAVFTALAASTVLVPVVAYLVARTGCAPRRASYAPGCRRTTPR